ncbi:ribbon-helix-helix protein, CopG family [Solicola gregarius]|uniref:Ribbon-helix-helix protein, CopG family n=1 Tax=Solicola gregarius TaxID=2908642 RepID=A0AA46THR1_9ACTN|nr:ribbon-helix-helix protein, CopG family [Solicola gregarius]UYM05042.1 ribbon-helix-helix protein, CopG family [Solicola gregarius]
MATNLRLRADAEEAVRSRAAETGQSQQEVIRDAVDRYLGLGGSDTPRTDSDSMIAERQVLPERSAFRELDRAELLHLPSGTAALDLLDRDDRL